MIDLLSATLLHFLWQGCLIAALLALALRLCATPQRRYLVALAALGLMAAAPLATAGWLHRSESAPVEKRLSDPAISIEVHEPTPPVESASAKPSLRPVVVGLWLVGVLTFTAFNTGGWLRLYRLRRSAVPVADREARMAALCRRVGLRRPVALLASARIDVPMVVGWLKPVVLVPASALTGMSAPSLEALVLHELAHVRRHDFLVNLLQAALETLLFYHPAVWWLSRIVRAEREHCCDDLAAGLCARRGDYLQALAELERRRLAPTLAVAADGGSLMDRIRRLTGNAAPASSTRWALGIGVLSFALGFGLVQLAAAPTTLAWNTESIEGEWRSESKRTHVQLELRMGRGHFNSTWLDHGQLRKTPTGYALERDAGTFELFGELDDGWSRFAFRPNRDYVEQMARIGFDVASSDRKLLEMATLDVGLDFARGIADAGYGDISTGKLVEFRIHGVTPEFVTEMAGSGLDGLSAGRLVEFRIHGVTPGFVEAMVDAGFEDLSPGRLVEFRIHGVTPEFVAGMADSGLDGLSPGRLVEFRIHGVSPDFVEEMASLGLRGLTAGRLVEMRIHGVTPDYVRRAQAEHGSDLSVSDLVSMRIHGRMH